MSFMSFVKSLGSGNNSPSSGPIASAGGAARLFTAGEVAAHHTEADCYTIVEGKVYDVTKYLRLHPGGFKLLYRNAGGDSTADFLALRHSAKSRVILDAYYVGDLVTGASSTLKVHATAQPTAPGRKIGSMVGPQPFLSLAPTSTASSTRGPATPGPASTASRTGPMTSALHSSTSHPDRLSAYTSFNQPAPKPAVPVASGSLAIVPPSTVAVISPPQRSPTTHALEHHLASHLSPPSEESPLEDSPSSFPSFSVKISPPVPRFAESSSPMDTDAESAASAISASATLGPRLFNLASRVQRTHDVQLLTFEPVFPPSLTLTGPPTACDSSSAVVAAASTAAASSAQPSALDPALWLHIPCGLHISIGVQLSDGRYVKRPYTPVSNQRGQFELLVKTYPSGVISTHLHAVPVNSCVEVWGPFGRFDYEHSVRQYSRWVLIAQGTGIAPLYQLLQHVRADASLHLDDATAASELEIGVQRLQLHLLDCNRSERDILLRDELAALERDSAGRFRVQHLLTQPSSPLVPGFVAGRLTAPLLHQFLAPLAAGPPSALSSTLFLLCGSDEFHASVSQLLRQTPLGTLQEEQIFCF